MLVVVAVLVVGLVFRVDGRAAGATAAAVSDLSFVWDRATEDQSDEAVRIWLHTPNRFLDQVSYRCGP